MLRGVTLELLRGDLVGVTGAVGSGKSTLLAGICGGSSVVLLQGSLEIATARKGRVCFAFPKLLEVMADAGVRVL